MKSLELENPVYYLSTNIIPAQRKIIIEEIKQDLSNNLKPILITTQVVEAGVDLDFDMGFRDIGPVDSIVQVAGRINRENDDTRKNAPLYVVNFIDEKENIDAAKVYGDLTYNQALSTLSGKKEIPEKDYQSLVENYFQILSEKKAFEKSMKLFNSMKQLRYDGEKEDHPVSSFRIIEQAPWVVSIFIEIDEKAKKARKAYEALLMHELSKEEFDKNYKQTFHQHIIGIPDYLPKVKELKSDESSYLSENLIMVRYELLEDYYSEFTGFNREKTTETEKVDML
jgi:CRISPR-associated endonuclease/helicase Cas3